MGGRENKFFFALSTSLYFCEVFKDFTGIETAWGSEACGEASAGIIEETAGEETAAATAAFVDETFMLGTTGVCGFLTGKSFPVTGKITSRAGAEAGEEAGA